MITKNLTWVNSTKNGKTLSCSENALKKFPKVSFFLIAGMQLYQYDKLGRLMSVHWWEGWTENMTPVPIMINRSSYSANTILLQPPSSCACACENKNILTRTLVSTVGPLSRAFWSSGYYCKWTSQLGFGFLYWLQRTGRVSLLFLIL